MVAKQSEVQLKSQQDVVMMRQVVRSWSIEAGFNLVDQTKVVTAASELARNAVVYGGGGMAILEILHDTDRKGLRLTFKDDGPGIPDVERAMQDGYTTGNGLGLGLGGARRLSSEFSIDSSPGKGTRVVITRWSK